MIEAIKRALDILLPRFLEEEVALVDAGDHYEILCSLHDLAPGERADAVATMRTFNLFGFALRPKMVGNPRRSRG